MASRPLGIIMNGVTGRMGYRQHLVRSILAIREQGGVLLSDGDRVQVEPLLVGPQRGRSSPSSPPARHRRLHHRPRRGARRPALRDLRRLPGDQAPGRGDPQGHRGGQGTSTPRSRPPRPSTRRSSSPRLARAAGIKNGVVHDKLYLPGLQKLKRLIDSGFFGRILSVRGEFGYWVFEGDWQPAQRPELELPGRGRRRHRRRHVPALELRAGEPVRPGRVGLRRRPSTHIPDPGRRAGQALRRHRRRRRLRRSSSSTGGVDRPDQLQLGGPGQPRRARRVPGRRHARQRGRRAVRLPDPARATPPRSRCGTPTCPTTHDYAQDWMDVPENDVFENGFKTQWEQFIRHVVEDAPHPLDFARRRPRRAAGRGRACESSADRPPGRPAGARPAASRARR